MNIYFGIYLKIVYKYMYIKKYLKMKLIMNLNIECFLKFFKLTLFENKNYILKLLNNRLFN